MQAHQATPARLEARGGYTLNDPIRQRHAARYEAGIQEPLWVEPTPSWYERWKPFKWFRKMQNAKKALANTSLRANEWTENRYALSYKNPNWAQRAVRWMQGKWRQWLGQEPPGWLEKADALLDTTDEAREVLEGLGLKPGGGYHAETIKATISKNVLAGTLTPKALGWAALTSVVQNVITYGFGEKRYLGLRSPEFFTSTMVDFGVNIALGLVTAGIVAGLVFVGWLPVSAVGLAALVTGFVVSGLWNLAGGPEWAEGIKQRWAQEIRQAGPGTNSDEDGMLEDWPDTPDGLAP